MKKPATRKCPNYEAAEYILYVMRKINDFLLLSQRLVFCCFIYQQLVLVVRRRLVFHYFEECGYDGLGIKAADTGHLFTTSPNIYIHSSLT